MILARPAARTLVALAGVAALVSFLRAARWPIGRYAVEGASMEPAYRDGERVVVNRLAFARRPPAAGDVVVLLDPERPGHTLLKRVAFDVAPGEEAVYVLGDNTEASRDSRGFGALPRSLVIGKVLFRY